MLHFILYNRFTQLSGLDFIDNKFVFCQIDIIDTLFPATYQRKPVLFFHRKRPFREVKSFARVRIRFIWAHPDNPQRDYNKALECFRRLVRDFPRSALKEKARVWIGAIDELTRRERQIKNLEETVSALKKRLNALKEIDISVEEKKRERLPLGIDR